jgi:glycerol-3-phosphate dehydrogenase (NAD(P)+)
VNTVVIIGAGVMGSAMALPFSDRGFAVKLVGTHLDTDIINSIKGRNFHPNLNVKMPPNVQGFFHYELAAELAKDCDIILLGVSSLGVSWAIEQLLHCMVRPTPILMITKGMHAEHNSLVALPDLIFKNLAEKFEKNVQVAAIAGPCIAGELAVRRSTGITIVARDQGYAEQLCNELETNYYHPRSSVDMIGVEICAAYKNFFAIAVGWAQGNLEKIYPADNKAKNNNAAAIIFDQAVRELMHLTTALGGQAESVWGMPGVGDLYVTCQAGRNSRLGNHLGRGLTYDQVRTGPMQGDTIEGADLGLATGASLKSMMAQGILNEASMPLTKSLLSALTDQKPLDIQWHKFHRTI